MKWLNSIAGVFCLIIAGCASLKNESEMKTEPVQFVHPDEYRRAEGFMVLADLMVFACPPFWGGDGVSDEEIEGKPRCRLSG